MGVFEVKNLFFYVADKFTLSFYIQYQFKNAMKKDESIFYQKCCNLKLSVLDIIIFLFFQIWTFKNVKLPFTVTIILSKTILNQKCWKDIST